MMPRLQAEETLEAASATALGSGTLRSHDAARLRQQLQRRAKLWRPVPADPRALAMMGIAVVQAPKRMV